MIQESGDVSYYEILDVKKNSTPAAIREAYLRAKNAFAADSLATYSLFDRSQSKKMLEEIESAYNILSDPDKRRLYDEAHGFIRSTFDNREMQELKLENGEEVSEIGLSTKGESAPLAATDSVGKASTAIEALLFDRANAENPASPAPPIFTSANRAPAADSPQENFAERFKSANSNQKTEQPLSKNFVPAASANPNAHFIHRRFEVSPEMEALLAEAESVDGAFLRRAREYKQVTVDEVMEFTKLSRRYVEALEQDNVDKLPAPVYVRGFVIQYAKSLQLDANKIAASYMRNFQSLREARGLR